MKIYIFGVDHGFQRFRNVPLLPNFDSYQEQLMSIITDLLKNKQGWVLAEEYSQEALEKYSDPETVLQRVARKESLRHLFCDPNTEERKVLRNPLDGESIYRPREEYWLEVLESELGSSNGAIFLCAYDHLDSFAFLCKERGHEVETKRIPERSL